MLIDDLCEQLPVAAALIDAQGLFTWVNRAYCELYGYQREELIGQSMMFVLSPEQKIAVFERHQAFLREEVADPPHEFSVEHRDGHSILVQSQGQLIIGKGGERYRLSVLTDITDQRAKESALLASEERHRALYEDTRFQIEILARIQEIVYALDREERILYWNPAAEQFFGVTAAEAEGRYIDDIYAYRWLKENSKDKLIEEIRQKGTVRLEQIIIPGTGPRVGDEVLVEVQASVVRNSNKQRWVLIVMRDLTERTLAEQHALEQEKVMMLQNFLGDVSHDFRTPLSILNTGIYLLAQEEDSDKRHQRLEKLQAHLDRLNSMVETMLNMAGLDHARELTLRKTSINNHVKEVFRSFEPKFTRQGLTLALDLDDTWPDVLLDTDAFTRAISQLLENALQYTPQGGEASVTVRQTLDWVNVEVSDTGIGIAEDERPHIFERFYRADKARRTNTGGSGLGLPIVARIVQLHGGHIEVESQQGQGSLFRVRLPKLAP